MVGNAGAPAVEKTALRCASVSRGASQKRHRYDTLVITGKQARIASVFLFMRARSSMRDTISTYELPWFVFFMTQNAVSTSRWHQMMDVGRRSPWLVLWTGQVNLTDEVPPPHPIPLPPSQAALDPRWMENRRTSGWTRLTRKVNDCAYICTCDKLRNR